jgi:hypothetical protein
MRLHPDFTKDVAPGSKVDFLDRGRAEIYINMSLIWQLAGDADLRQFVGGLFEASRGDPQVKALLLEKAALDSSDHEGLSAKFANLWDEFQATPPIIDGLATLREFCSRDSWWWPESMITALFDDPAFDAVAYVDWHNSPD